MDVMNMTNSTDAPWWESSTTNTSVVSGVVDEADDAIWILTSTFIIFTMQSGFGLLESGSVTTKNEVNIMVKNAVDVIFGGLSFWAFGYAFSFGEGKYDNAFFGWGNFFVDAAEDEIGHVYSRFFFQASFATTATTIVSGGMAERTRLEAYIVFSFLNTFIFCLPAHWVWAKTGFLNKLGMVDVAGAGPVHLVGGVTALVATLMLKPRHGRYESKHPPPMGSPTNALLGMFMLWWGWLGFNCGSTFGISGYKWKLAARSAVSTLNASVSGGCVSMLARSAITTLVGTVGGGIVALLGSYVVKRGKFDINYLINGILGALVGITGFCALAEPWESFLIGVVGSTVSLAGIELLNKLKIDDPVGCIGVHFIGGVWSLLCIGIFAKQDKLRSGLDITHDHFGLIYGGGFYLLGVQLAGVTAMVAWSAVTAFILLKIVDLTIGLRVPLHHEILGADLVEHAVGDIEYDKKQNKVLCTVTGRNLNSEYGLTEEGELSEIPEFNGTRRRRSVLKLGDSITAAAQLSLAFANINKNPKVLTENDRDSSPRASRGEQPRRRSIAFDLSGVLDPDGMTANRANQLWKLAGHQTLAGESKRVSRNGIGKRLNVFRRPSKPLNGKMHTNGRANGHTTRSNDSSKLGHRQSNGDGQENKAFTSDNENDTNCYNGMKPVSSSDVLINCDTLPLDQEERIGGVGEENPIFSTYI